MADKLDPTKCRVKVGKELFTAEGPALVRTLVKKGFQVFLDLKFHDIPNTVAKAVTAAAELGVWMVNVHASGGKRMMQAAHEALKPYGANAPLLIAVTVLTSTEEGELNDIGLDCSINGQVLRLATLAKDCGLDGVVCSAQEAEMLKGAQGPEFQLVTPGIRPASATADDQRRIMTPSQALKAGVDYMVIGRPITQAEDPQQALNEILKECGA
ncbi:orotidine 5'-phosphate decarboxylase [Simiduia agarivorans SA1 = DSM 21679]|uniref:Orotidine 5'-phosphate decarboxylase n=2 Tax=Simiduia TaxID=447467 RepID=K4KHS9_SIMAS|nr:orotidine 5'-phosphate decarboxylase [Simiduia agarivorans SA1 = DSM 21679]